MPATWEYWKVNDPLPYPVGDIDVIFGNTERAEAECVIKFPAAIPDNRNIAEHSVGIAHSWRFAFGIRCKRTPGGGIDSEIICTAEHVTWFPEHGETGP